jgi:hypothetical protein
MMVRVIFQANIHTTVDNSMWVEAPRLCLQYCVVEDFKSDPEWRALLFSSALDEVLEAYTSRLFEDGHQVNLDNLPEGASVDVFGSLAIVTIDLIPHKSWLFPRVRPLV